MRKNLGELRCFEKNVVNVKCVWFVYSSEHARRNELQRVNRFDLHASSRQCESLSFDALRSFRCEGCTDTMKAPSTNSRWPGIELGQSIMCFKRGRQEHRKYIGYDGEILIEGWSKGSFTFKDELMQDCCSFKDFAAR